MSPPRSVSWVEPETVFAAVAATHDRVFWLDGGGTRDWSGRWSYLGWLEPGEPSLTYDAASRTVVEHDGHGSQIVGDDIFAVLDARTGACEQPTTHPNADAGTGHDGAWAAGFDGWVGYLGYACRPDLPARLAPAGGAPDAVWMRVRRYVVFDHGAGTVRLHGTETLPQRPTPTRPEPAPPHAQRVEPVGPSYDTYRQAFERVQEELRAGNSYEANLTYRMEMRSPADPHAVYLRLRRGDRAPYSAFLRHDGVSVLSSSPERFATIGRDGHIETRPIKGTTERSTDPAVDRRRRELLRTDPRFRAENLMVVDLLRNDLSRVCEPGSIVVPQLMQVESYPAVHQLVTTIGGRLRADVSGVRAVEALFPGGSMTGAPKRRTMRILSEVETTARGVYSGALGWIGADGRADLGIVIRTLVHHGSTYSLGTGGAITVRSDPHGEFAESRWKAERLLRALSGGAPGGE